MSQYEIRIVKTLPGVLRERIFAAWTDPVHLKWFFNPSQPLPSEPATIDDATGVWRQKMVVSPTQSYITGGVFSVRHLESGKIVFTWGADGGDGWPKLSDGLEARVSVQDEQMVFEMTLPSDWESKDVVQCRDGWTETLDRFVPAPPH
ncbi:hypothetical protein EXIGLDRAFT_728115 [Exidia glandulosa HHB12029]|uniref:Activator of Hsp90 ATPase homologue 1/2-like C-terminal domain-containing protein n=1 Tax=Exidia glandulosa HHB12029 TaxID=1314781 RepID=A0A165LVF1_EXIGL|nr:hypothetical protein EXIGLDRAFT_728115 [Exidia glandulosa HHB12029]